MIRTFVIEDKDAAVHLAAQLVAAGRWFVHTPLGHGRYEFVLNTTAPYPGQRPQEPELELDP